VPSPAGAADARTGFQATEPALQHAALRQMWSAGAFEPSIHHIRFPLFKNLAPGTRVDFLHPVTAIVGPNGTNKSSILRALQGSPGMNNLGVFWFGTALDAIPSKERHRFIYGRYSPTTKGTVEVIKSRIARPAKKLPSGRRRAQDPDYWEPSRPLLRPPDSMDPYPPPGVTSPPDGSGTRWNPVDMPVLYLDFRSELSAFDRAFYHGGVDGRVQSAAQAQNQRKASIRRWAPRVKRAVDGLLTSDLWYRSERITAQARQVTEQELAAIEYVLGRRYESVTVVRHRYFAKADGWTAVMRSGGHGYSEAFAGSGEFAIIMIVTKTLTAPARSLLLLDEPEVSLHPGAQTRLMQFLVAEAKRRHHQVVLATHSADIIRDLPPEAIKVLVVNESTGRVELPVQRSSAPVAFQAIGTQFTRPAVVVEDELARAVVEHALSGEAYADTVDVRVRPGGAGDYWVTYLPDWAARAADNVLVYFDGDQTCASVAAKSVTDADLEAEVVRALNGNHPRLVLDGGGDAGHDAKRNDVLRAILRWRAENVAFFPFLDPETYLWPHREAEHEGPALASAGGAKKAWRDHAVTTLGGRAEPRAPEILALQRQALGKVPSDSPELVAIRARVAAFVDRCQS